QARRRHARRSAAHEQLAVVGTMVGAAHRGVRPPTPVAIAVLEVTSVADDEAVVFEGPVARRYDGLEPDRDYELDGASFRTLPRPPGERLATVATVNDVHFGETECG